MGENAKGMWIFNTKKQTSKTVCSCIWFASGKGCCTQGVCIHHLMPNGLSWWKTLNYHITQSFFLQFVEDVNIYNFLLGIRSDPTLPTLYENKNIWSVQNTKTCKNCRNKWFTLFKVLLFHIRYQISCNSRGFFGLKNESLPSRNGRHPNFNHIKVCRVLICGPIPSSLNLAVDATVWF